MDHSLIDQPEMAHHGQPYVHVPHPTEQIMPELTAPVEPVYEWQTPTRQHYAVVPAFTHGPETVPYYQQL